MLKRKQQLETIQSTDCDRDERSDSEDTDSEGDGETAVEEQRKQVVEEVNNRQQKYKAEKIVRDEGSIYSRLQTKEKERQQKIAKMRCEVVRCN